MAYTEIQRDQWLSHLFQSCNYPELLFSRLIKTAVARISSWQELMVFSRHTYLLNSLGS